VKIPSGLKPVQNKNNWSVYLMNDSVCVAVYSSEKLGIMAVAEGYDPATFLDHVVHLNSDRSKLEHQFMMPEGTIIGYDVNCSKDQWVIQSIDGKPVDRKFDKWPLIRGDFFRKPTN